MKQQRNWTTFVLSCSVFGFSALGLSVSAQADQAPTCYARQTVLPVNNAQVAAWKTSTPDQFHGRGHIFGTVSRLYPNETGHLHFEVVLAGTPNVTLEIIYNLGFDSVDPVANIGDAVESCGDYISAPQGGHNPSPDDAILHWVHKSDDVSRHDDGYMMINGVLYGEQLTNN